MENVRIPAGTNYNFTDNTVIRGVLYLEGSCRITFSGNVDIQGVIVADNNAGFGANGGYFLENITHRFSQGTKLWEVTWELSPQ